MATTLKRTQMYFPEDMLQQVRQVADNEHTTIAEVVRSAVGEFLKTKKHKEVDWDTDPLWNLAENAGSSGSRNGSEEHNTYLYEAK